LKYAKALVSQCPAIDAIEMQRGGVCRKARPDSRRRIVLGPIDELREVEPIELGRPL
jgi:hypothetical protein